MRIGFATIYSWRPHVEHAAFLARLVESAGHEASYLVCDSDLPSCYTRESRDRPAWLECTLCRAGSLRSYASNRVDAIGSLAAPRGGVSHPEWAYSSASTLGRFESDEDYASPEFAAYVAKLEPAVRRTHAAAKAWITSRQLDAVCVFNGRIDATRAIFEAARSLGVRVVTMERTWFGDGIQIYPDETCLGLQSVNRLVDEWKTRPLTGPQALHAASYMAKRFLRRNDNEWRAYNVGAQQVAWPSPNAAERILLIPSSRNEVWGHPDWQSGWANPVQAYDALMEHLHLKPADVVLRCHPNWAENIGVAGGQYSERYYSEWAKKRGVHCIASSDSASTLGLIQQCTAIVVANGSAALEAGALGKQVISLSASAYAQAGFRDTACDGRQLQSLRLHSSLDAATVARLREQIPRMTLRFLYTVARRIPQYSRFVRAESTTQFRYDMSASPERLVDLLKGGGLQADDGTCGASEEEENPVLALWAGGDWKAILDRLPVADTSATTPFKRRVPYRPLDAVRQWMPLGDR